jgi:hypothetical protein
MLQKEVTMKKLLLIALLAAIPTMAQAAISVDQQTSPKYIQNSGYSAQTADAVSVVKARGNGQEFYTKDETSFRKQNWFTKFWRKLYVYTDPASEDYSFYHHDTDTTPSYKDF